MTTDAVEAVPAGRTDGTSDGPSLPEVYAGLSGRLAQGGDEHLARLAAWAGDVHVLEELLWEHGLGGAPDPSAELAVVGGSVADTLAERADSLTVGLTSRQVLELAREALLSTFDASVHDLVEERLADLEHLCAGDEPDGSHDDGPHDDGPYDDGPHDDGPSDAQEPHDEPAVVRLEGRSPEHLVAELLVTSGDCMAVAVLMAHEGGSAGAARLARQSDCAAFEAYLTAAAVLAGDHRLATVDLRWALARALPARDVSALTDASPDTLAQVTGEARGDLLGLVGSAERVVLVSTFEPWGGR